VQKIIRYEVIYEDRIAALEEEVINMMCDEWQPLGGVCASYDHKVEGEYYFQAMVKYAD
jgi:hypothetical protein